MSWLTRLRRSFHRARYADEARRYLRLRDKARQRGDETSVGFYTFRAKVEVTAGQMYHP